MCLTFTSNHNNIVQCYLSNPTHYKGVMEMRPIQGRIQDFKLGGGALKFFLLVFRVKNHDFMPKNHIFVPILQDVRILRFYLS
jgi:hypothetical protein